MAIIFFLFVYNANILILNTPDLKVREKRDESYLSFPIIFLLFITENTDIEEKQAWLGKIVVGWDFCSFLAHLSFALLSFSLSPLIAFHPLRRYPGS